MGRPRRPVAFLAVGAAVALLSASRGAAGLLTDSWWFSDLGQASVWRTRLLTTIALFVLGTLIVALVGAIVVRSVGRAAPFDPPDSTAARLRFLFGGRARAAGAAAVAALVMLLAPALTHNTSIVLLMANGDRGMGPRDPVFHRPLGFYLFELPFLRAITGWLLAVTAVMMFVVIISAHIVGAWRPGQPGGRLPQSLRMLVSIFGAGWFVLRAIGLLLDRWQLVASGSGYVDGPGATDLRTRLPGLLILAGIALLVAAAILYGGLKRDLVVPGVAVVASIVALLVINQIIPRAYRQLQVKPNSPAIETRSIQRNIDATRAAYGLSGVLDKPLTATDSTPASTSLATRTKVADELASNARIWGPAPRTVAAFNKVLSVDYLRVLDVDMDRYVIEGSEKLVAVGALDRVALKTETWSQRHLERTHGYGMMVAPAGEVVGEGDPRLVSTGLAGKAVAAKQPRLYVGEGTDSFVVAGTASETDPVLKDNRASRYTGAGGVRIGGFWKKAVFALHFSDRNLLVRSVDADAKVLFVRNIRTRAEKLAPFLRYDADPYPVVLRDRIVWVIDGYTVTNNYPYAQHFDTGAVLDPSSGLAGVRFNSVRASVKVVIDGYDGQVSMYRTAPKGTDAILDAWASVHRSLFRNADRLDKDWPGLRSHLRYPEDLFRLQAVALGRYHVTLAAAFVDPTNDWTPSVAAPSTSIDRNAAAAAAASVSTASSAPDPGASTRSEDRAQVDPDSASLVAQPLFLRHRYPGESSPSFVLQQTLELRRSASQRRLLRAVIVADSDPKNYGRVRLLRIPSAVEVLGPTQAFDRMRANPRVSTLETQLGQVGSKVNFGDVQVLPTDAGVVYQRPLFLIPESSVIEELKYVLVLAADRVTIEPSLRTAFRQALGAPVDSTGSTGSTGSTTGSPPGGSSAGSSSTGTAGGASGAAAPRPTSAADVLSAAAQALDDADAALKAGDLGLYQQRVDDARQLLAAATKTTATTTASTSTTAPSTTASTTITTQPKK